MFWYWQVDGWIALAGALCAVACALVGNFLVLRRLSLIGDAISHAVLPGIAAAFLWSGSRSQLVALIGAVAVGMLTVWLTELIRRFGSVEESAAIGVVFTALFALGIMMVSRAEHVDLDPSCVLYGNLETIILEMVSTPFGKAPLVVVELASICCFNALVIFLFYRQWTLSTFDPTMAQAQGIPVGVFHYALAAMVAVTCIISFRAVGNILVVAMLIVPPATAYLLCNRLAPMIGISAMIACIAAVLGHLSAITLPHMIGFKSANSAAMIAVVAGLLLLLAAVFSPKSGVLVRWLSQRKLSRRILGEDILALLYRESEQSPPALAAVSMQAIADRLKISISQLAHAGREMVRNGYLTSTNGGWALTPNGYRHAQNLIRSHRLWEQFLSVETGLGDHRLHTQAESLEHYTSSELRTQLDRTSGSPSMDPHGKQIPPES